MSVFLVGIYMYTVPTSPRTRLLSVSTLPSWCRSSNLYCYLLGAFRRSCSMLSVWRAPPGLGLVDFGEVQDRVCWVIARYRWIRLGLEMQYGRPDSLLPMHVWLYNTFATFTMCRRITLHNSRVVEPDGQLPRYGLCKRTAHQMASDNMSHDDASKHQSPPERPKRTPTFTRAHSLSSNSSSKNRTMKGLGRRRTRKHEDKAWFAEAILEESGSQYLIKY
jgi:hypothetical protein